MQQTKYEIAKQFIGDSQEPSMTLAKALQQARPEVFATVNAAYNCVRRLRGELKLGGNGRGKTLDPVAVRTPELREQHHTAGVGQGKIAQTLERDRLIRRARDLESQVSQLKQAHLALVDTVDWLKDMQDRATQVEPPDWSNLATIHKGHRSVGIPMSLWSDWHWGEVVDPKQIHNANIYNIQIAQDRAKRLVDRTILLCKHYVNSDYPGIVVMVAGDMLSGDIHEELTITNELTTMQALLDIKAHMQAAIGTLADAFKRVWLTFVIGNHTRTTLKPRAKGAAYTSYDWMLGKLLQQDFKNDKRVTINVSDSLDEQVKVANMTFNLTHGDQFRGGSGIQGAFAPWFIGDYRKHKRQRTLHADYDYLVMGHWHQAAMVGGMIVNSSLKGYDEFAFRNNFPFEKPQQWLWIAHPEKGIVYRIPILVGEGD